MASILPDNFQDLEKNVIALYDILPDLKVIGTIDDSIKCCRCQGVMVHSYQASCGHRFCGPCIQDIAVVSTLQRCPKCQQIFLHNQKIRRSSMESLIEGQVWNVLVSCPHNCQEAFKLKDIMDHVADCPAKLKSNTSSSRGHLPKHVLKNLSQTVSRLEFDDLKDEFVRKFSQMENEISQLKQSNFELEEQVWALRKEIDFLYSFLQDNPQACRFLSGRELQERLMQSQPQSADSASGSTDATTTTNVSGSITWKITSYLDLETRAKNGRDPGAVLSSEAFYTFKEGYLFRLDAYPNGHGAASGTHLSLSVVSLRGKYDDRLSWPFFGQVNIGIVDRLQNSVEVSAPVKVDKPRAAPRSYHLDRAFSLDDIRKTESYVLDDCVYLAVTIKPLVSRSAHRDTPMFA